MHTDQQGTHVTTNEQGQPVLIIDFAPFDTIDTIEQGATIDTIEQDPAFDRETDFYPVRTTQV